MEKELWNEMLAFTKKFYIDYDKFPTKRTLRSFCKNNGLYSQVGQELAERLNRAIWRMVALKKRGKNCGFPRFKSFDQVKSLSYPQSGFSLGNMCILPESKMHQMLNAQAFNNCRAELDKSSACRPMLKFKVTPFGEIHIRQHREIKGTIKTLAIKRATTGKWFACFAVEETPIVKASNGGARIGIDLGLKNLATLSDGSVVENPRLVKKHEEKVASLSRKLSQKKKGSRNRKKAKMLLAIEHEKLKDTRRDFLHRLSRNLVNSYSFIALEDLASQELAEQNYGKQINDAGWGELANMLRYKAESAGCEVVFVNPKDTTKTCCICGNIMDMPLSVREYDCQLCGNNMDRDQNAAYNILKRATGGTPGSNACGDVSRKTSMKQEAPLFFAERKRDRFAAVAANGPLEQQFESGPFLPEGKKRDAFRRG